MYASRMPLISPFQKLVQITLGCPVHRVERLVYAPQVLFLQLLELFLVPVDSPEQIQHANQQEQDNEHEDENHSFQGI
jgi:hypothetical protein